MRAQPETGHLLLPSVLAPAAEEETEAQTSGGASLPKDKGSLSWNQHPLGSRGPFPQYWMEKLLGWAGRVGAPS